MVSAHVLSLSVSVLVILGGCSVPARTVSEPVSLPDAFSMEGTASVQDRWWETFGDDGLIAVIDTALMNNFDVKAAWERLQAARAVMDREASLLWPSIEAAGTAESVQTDDENVRAGESARLNLAASYEIDLWGRIRSGVEAERLRAEATVADYQTAVLSLSAEITRVWVQIAEAQEQISVVNQQVETNTAVLQLIENRFALGLVRAVDILRQRQLVERTREQRVIAESRLGVLEHQLAVLLGRPPQTELALRPSGLPDLPPLPDPGVPVDLIQRRPDVQQAFLQLRAADQDVASAISNQFPRFSLSVSTASASGGGQQLFRDWATTLAGNVLAPIFLGGERKAEVDRTEAVRQERLYLYGQTVLLALQDVEDALVLEDRQLARIGLLEVQLQLADQTFEQLRIQYLNGTNNYLDVLTALDDVQVLRRDLLAARLTLVDHRIALYRALAGSVQDLTKIES